MLVQKIIKVYTDYVIEYSKQVDKYMVNRCEEDCLAEIALCNDLYDVLTLLVDTFSVDDEMAYDIIDMLSVTDKDKKIDMANNLKNLFDYIK